MNNSTRSTVFATECQIQQRDRSWRVDHYRVDAQEILQGSCQFIRRLFVVPSEHLQIVVESNETKDVQEKILRLMNDIRVNSVRQVLTPLLDQLIGALYDQVKIRNDVHSTKHQTSHG